MSKIIYFFFYQFSKLSLNFLYKFSGVLYFIIYKLVGYRRKIVAKNLKNAFPEKSDIELLSIEKKFYKNFIDYLIETLKGFSISEKELVNRFQVENIEELAKIKAENKDAILMAGHVFNWEWILSFVPYLNQENIKTTAVFHKLRNPFWNQKIIETRSKFGTEQLDMKQTSRAMLKKTEDAQTIYLFVADQSPKKSAIHYDLKFLNQDTPVFVGFDKIAIRKEMTVFYCDIIKNKQGKYTAKIIKISPDKEKFDNNEVVNKFYDELEKTIKENPDNWLWTHKRWKYKKDIDF